MSDLLFLTQRLPYPPTKGEKIRSMRLLDHLRRSHDVHLGCLVDDPHDLQHLPAVRAMCASTHIARLDRRRARLTCLLGLLTGEPLSVTFYRNRGLANWVGRVLREIKPSAIVVSSSNMAPYILDRPRNGRIRIVDLVDVDSEKWRAYASTETSPMRHVHAREARLVAQLETRIARDCDWNVLVSHAEAALFASRHPTCADRIRAIANGVDHAYFDPTIDFENPFAAGWPNFVFTGTMDYRPNVEAVTWFAETILPLIRIRLPDARLHIVGANPAPRVAALSRLEGVFVVGRVVDMRPFLAHATTAVAPMRIGRGIQNKVLEAMAMARPVVATPEALEGIEAIAGREILLGDSAEAFAAACVRATEPASAAIGAAARARVVADHLWSETLRGFDPLLAGAGPLR